MQLSNLKMKIYWFCYMLGFPMLLLSQQKVDEGKLANTMSKKETEAQMQTVTDIDNNVYQTIQIGDQVWMAENLKVTKYRNGDPIPYVTNGADWDKLTSGAFCIYGNNPENKKMFGNLYNFFAVADSRRIAPLGWHVATHAEWTTLIDYLKSKDESTIGSASNCIGKSISAQKVWRSASNPEMIGCDLSKNNKSGFNALPGSFRFTDGEFTYPIGGSANFWTSTENGEKLAWNRYLQYDGTRMVYDSGRKAYGLSVRCVKGELPELQPNPNTVTDIDKNVYTTVKIGKQVWMAENLNVSRYRNGDKIPYVVDGITWDRLISGAYCYYENKLENEKIYGKLYNFYVISDKRGIAPLGWHVPTDEEWAELAKFLASNGYNADGSKVGNFTGKAIASVNDWKVARYSDQIGCDLSKNNKSNFNALPGSFRFTDGAFTYPLGSTANFWSSTENRDDSAWNRYMSCDSNHMSRDSGRKNYGLSIRCIKD